MIFSVDNCDAARYNRFMSGWINETDLDAAEESFPGIRDFWEGFDTNTNTRPKTFLELVFLYGRFMEKVSAID